MKELNYYSNYNDNSNSKEELKCSSKYRSKILQNCASYILRITAYFSSFSSILFLRLFLQTLHIVPGKRLLTMIFRKNNVMLLFLMPDGKAESVKRVFDYLETGLGIDVFRRLFPVILTDNGSEFKKVDELELTLDEDGFLVYRTSLYYCDPMASWQKGCIEKNHEFIRYAVPKGKSLNPYTQEDMTLLMNHINSVKRPGLGNKSPYELVEEDDEDFKALMSLLKMHLIPPDEVHLMPDLFVKK